MPRNEARHAEGAATPLSCFCVQRGSGTFGRMPAVLNIALCTSLLWSGLASAQVTATGDYLARMDVDGDGRIALAEYQAWMGYAFERMDANRDGQLTADELPGGKGRTISLTDHRESLAAMFRRQDANADGFLSAKELAAPPR